MKTRIDIIVAMLALLTPVWVHADDVSEGRRIFMEETFGGNGRTCATCHVESLNFRLTPANVAQRFANVAQTFDPLFVAETNINLNTLNVNTAVSFPAGAILTGTSSSGQAVRAKVLTSVTPTSYLVYGGISPAFGAGRSVSDGTRTSKVVSIVRGNLNQLENSKLLRGPSVSPDFPQGRALILENPDGFDQPPVFRKVPHLQNLGATSPFGFDNNLELDEITTRAVRQHFTRTMARREGIDFRLPTAEELRVLAEFMRSLTSMTDPNDTDRSNFARTAAQRRGETAFGPCNACHFDRVFGGRGEDPTQLATGIANLAINGPAPGGDNLPLPPPTDANFGSIRPVGVPGLLNIKNNAPFFHDNSAATLEAAIRFYTTTTFGNSAGARDAGFKAPIQLNDAQVTDLAAFLGSFTQRNYSVEDSTGLDLTRRDFQGRDTVLNFGIRRTDAGGASQTLTVRNISATASVKFNSPACVVRELIGSVSAHFTSNCSQLNGVTLAPGQTRQITVTFDPAAEGVRTPILEILTSETTGVDLFGEGRNSAARVDRFDTDTIAAPPAWQIGFGANDAFRVSGGQLRMTRCTGCRAPNGNILLNDFPLTENFDYSIKGIATADSNDSNDFSVIFNMQDRNNPDRDYYYASFNERADKAGLFMVTLLGGKQLLAPFPATAPGGSSASLYSIRIEKRGSHIRVFNGSTLYADVTEGSFSGGFAGVGSLNDSGRFDDFIVTPLP
jgi:cytochrome c peroxidase